MRRDRCRATAIGSSWRSAVSWRRFAPRRREGRSTPPIRNIAQPQAAGPAAFLRAHAALTASKLTCVFNPGF
ncbi:hypothetical protein BRAO375_530022 [Bradyrhizobium sp. ORS 375]|nr:hypothetical protein BRAO375_530022 [Bradyrhizobium sp. ORS 375]